MAAQSIVRSVCSVFKSFWKRHRENLGLAVAGVLLGKRVGVASIGRSMPAGTCPKHAIKRLDRFLSNDRLHDDEAQATLLHTVVGPRKRILIAVYWTKIRDWQVLVAGVIQCGRCIPILWSVMDPRRRYKSQNAFENGFISALVAALPSGTDATVLLDRGFRRISLVKHLRSVGLSFVIRIPGKTMVRHESYCGLLSNMPLRPNRFVDMPDAEATADHPASVRIVSIRKRGQKEPWHLMTDRPESCDQVANMYAKRFHIEETFRDQKEHRFGLSLGYLKVTRADRLTRVLLVAAVAHFVAMLVGAAARATGLDRLYRANTPGKRGRKAHSDFTLGLYYAPRVKLKRVPRLQLLWSHGCM